MYEAGLASCGSNEVCNDFVVLDQHPSEKWKEIVLDIIAGTSKTHGEEVKPVAKLAVKAVARALIEGVNIHIFKSCPTNLF